MLSIPLQYWTALVKIGMEFDGSFGMTVGFQQFISSVILSNIS